ncbi:hypothetical protein LSH36_8g11000 [Paralvinella palmiformis]|uniref:Uncharacterized protein n=1 Tax=Paralvinella palmiformis TaxID=53620 RepID=A0AAD9KEB6_9ANNE|nr:hypothetical protein LSH36_8g11000 [Paralvinella palmiformis]
MDRESRSELLKTIEAQKEKIHKYESKLRDLITAYKGVVKEKEALEASVKALVASEPVPNSLCKKAVIKSDTDGPEGEGTDTSDTQA